MGRQFWIAGDLSDDGKRFDALDVVFRAGGCYRGGSLREGSGSPIFADGTLGGTLGGCSVFGVPLS